MATQQSFAFKPTRILVFSITISFSLTFLAFFSIWVIHSSPTLHRETQFDLESGAEPLAADYGKNSSSNQDTSAVLIGTQFAEFVDNTTRFANFSRKGSEENDSGEEKVLTHVNSTVRLTAAESSTDNLNSSVLIAPHQKNYESSTQKLGSAGGIKGNSLIINQHRSETVEVSSNGSVQESSDMSCDVTKGKWVFDKTYPLYTKCAFIHEGFNCQKNGRLDKDYMKWRWQPHDCNIPRFNATTMLNSIRGKRLVFVGDSINRNQYESMVCLLMTAIKDPKRVYEARGQKMTKEKGDRWFKFLDYKCTVEYYVSHFLVQEGEASVGEKRPETLRIDTIHQSASRWKGADIIVFNSAHWWNHNKTTFKVNYYQEGEQVHPRLDVSVAFRKALMTWGSWLNKYINLQKTKVFFRSTSPSHFRGGQWYSGGHCGEASQPLNETSRTSYSEKNIIVGEVLRQINIPVTILNITRMSEYRVDGHPSVYGRRLGKRSSGRQDCSHWCLPGVPDMWNELLYFYLQTETQVI